MKTPLFPFKVRVLRDAGLVDEEFVSAVYAIDIDNDNFLVYDPGLDDDDGNTIAVPGFEWVHFPEKVSYDGTWERTLPRVSLWDEEDEEDREGGLA